MRLYLQAADLPGMDRKDSTGQPGRDTQDGTARTDCQEGLPGHNIQERIAKAGQPGQDSLGRTARTGLPGKEKPGKDSQDFLNVYFFNSL